MIIFINDSLYGGGEFDEESHDRGFDAYLGHEWMPKG
jgi:hypothetical protein